jgi:hypothetical protein
MENLYWVMLEESEHLEVPFPSELVYEQSIEWYNELSKKQIIEYCKKHYVSLSQDEDTLKSFWATLAMAVYAWVEVAPDPRMLNLIDQAQLKISQ